MTCLLHTGPLVNNPSISSRHTNQAVSDTYGVFKALSLTSKGLLQFTTVVGNNIIVTVGLYQNVELAVVSVSELVSSVVSVVTRAATPHSDTLSLQQSRMRGSRGDGGTAAAVAYLGAHGVYVIVVQSMPQWPLDLPATLKLSKHRRCETRELAPHSNRHCDSSDRHRPL